MSRPVWIEAALNGPWGRSLQPRIPITADEILRDALAAADAGAAILHFHAYDEVSGRQRDAWELYAPVIERIRAARDVIVYPTIPLAGGPDAVAPLTAAQRFLAVEELARRGLIEWTVVDPGSAMFSRLEEARRNGATGFLYENPEDHVRHGLALCAEYGLTPSFAIYEPGFARLGAALAEAAACPVPVYRLMFSDGFSFGYPPAPYALDACLPLLGDVAPGAPWMLAGLDVDLTDLVAETVRRGGHVRAGLEDARLGEKRSNPELVADAVGRVLAAGSRPASAAEIRATLAASI